MSLVSETGSGFLQSLQKEGDCTDKIAEKKVTEIRSPNKPPRPQPPKKTHLGLTELLWPCFHNQQFTTEVTLSLHVEVEMGGWGVGVLLMCRAGISSGIKNFKHSKVTKEACKVNPGSPAAKGQATECGNSRELRLAAVEMGGGKGRGLRRW